MKKSIFQTVFKGIWLVILIISAFSSQAQLIDYTRWSQEEKENKSLELINEATYVVEGDIVKFECFYGDDGKTIYTDLMVRVNRWYKGEGEDIIHVIQKGGLIGEDNQYEMHSSGPYTPMGLTYILLLKQHSSGENYVFSKASDRIIARSIDDFYMVGFYGLFFDNVEEFNQFIAKAKKIRLPNKKKDVGSVKSSLVPTIQFINPLPIDPLNPNPTNPVTRAGTGEIIVISGSGFGDDRGDVLFVDADRPEAVLQGPLLYLLGLDDIYYDTSDANNPDGWKDDEIRVIVPSNVLKGNSQNHGAGSGKIKVKLPDVVNDDGVVIEVGAESEPSPQKLTIEYSLKNSGGFNINEQTERPMSAPRIGMEHCLSGYVFTLHKSFDPALTELSPTQRQDAINSIESALTTWRDLLDITLELERNSDNSYYYHPATGEINRNIISFVNYFVTPGENTPKLMRTQNRGIEWDNMCSSPSDCPPIAFRVTGSNILIKKDKDPTIDDDNDGTPDNLASNWFYPPTGVIVEGGPLTDFHAAMLHEIGHAIGVGHDVKLNAIGNINRHNLMSYGFISQDLSEAARINLTNNANDKGIDAAEKIVVDSRNHEWSEDFFDRFGIKTLAGKDYLSDVQPTPTIDTYFWGITDGGKHQYLLIPDQAFNYDYYWADGVVANWRFLLACGNARPSQSTHYVRIKHEDCTESSLYSLPETIGDNCWGIERDDEDDSLPVIQPLINIYPNPTKGHFNIQFNPIEGEEISYIEDTYIGVYDNLGNLQKQHAVDDTTLRQTTIDISTLPAGTYWVVWFADGEVIDTQQVQKTN